MDKDKKELCTIRIIFPVESDEKAIEYKKKIADLLAEIPDAQIQFGLSSVPTRPSMGM
ncbi:unnamed protein product [marine sediment metagenome]|uniref:Uncharacterized protein n=1 Tax=marine sediment metagenome TaxID=412755 RepID=X1V1U3_9ZZZZ